MTPSFRLVYIFFITALLSNFPSLCSARSRRFDRYLSRLFHEAADVNRDGTVSFDECYQSLLIFYTYLNQLAPIPPPKRERVKQLYASADWDSRAGLQETEFKLLAGALASRATLRLAMYKAVSWIAAPILSTVMLNLLQGTTLVDRCRRIVEKKDWIPSAVTTRPFWMMAFLVMNVSNLGMLVLWLMDEMLLTRFKPMQKLWIPEKLDLPTAEL